MNIKMGYRYTDTNKQAIIRRALKQKKLERDATNWRKHYIETSKALNDLLNQIPRGGKYLIIRRMIKVFWVNKMEVSNYLLAGCIEPTISNRNNTRVKFTKRKYQEGKVKFDKKIKNCLRTVRKHVKPFGYKVNFGSQTSKMIPPNNQL